jgi:superfamily II DNA or RNA helicase
MDRWPHQEKVLEEVPAAIARGTRRILVASPTGGGKTAMMQDLAGLELDRGGKVALYTNRRLLLDQTSRVMACAGLDHGIRAAGHAADREQAFQVASIQTEHSRVIKRGVWPLHDARLVLVDEAHLHASKMARRLLDKHAEQGAAIVGFTATPIDLGSLYDVLIQAGTTSELRECGALVPCKHYGPDEPDLRHIGRVPLGEDLSEAQNRQAIMVNGIFGRVWEWWKRLNPDSRPAILFAPGVAESIWFAEQFHAQGVRAAHIDGQEVWLDGRSRPTSRDAREEILRGSESGEIPVICNRFVLREGIDAPWLCHCIFATVFGSLQSYLQSGGRLLRAHPGVESVTLQDHCGNWWRHGSLNADRLWHLDDTALSVTGMYQEQCRAKRCRWCGHRPLLSAICPQCGKPNVVEPASCPKCRRILQGPLCPCGFEVDLRKCSRPVVQADGYLQEMEGDIYRPLKVSRKPNGPQLWEKMYYRSKTEKGERTFRAAAALFARENNWAWPDPTWPLMPTNERDWFRLVKDVPQERLTTRR